MFIQRMAGSFVGLFEVLSVVRRIPFSLFERTDSLLFAVTLSAASDSVSQARLEVFTSSSTVRPTICRIIVN